MDVIKDPRSYERNKKNYNTLVHILKDNGNCMLVGCTQCLFSYNRYNIYKGTTTGLCCRILDNFNVSFNSYNHLKIYYIAMVLSLYTEAERLTYLIQDS
jgi:hypothetical protein